MAQKTFTIWDLNKWDTELIWDDASSSLTKQVKNNHSKVFRKAYIKRRQLSDGLFESEWVEITNDVKKWGSINSNIDYQRHGKLSFSGAKLLMQNIEGKYNPNDNADSLWSGFGDQQRTLVKIEAGFYFQWLGTDNVWHIETFPEDPTIFVGILSGNMKVSGDNEVSLNIKPLTQVFRDYPANLLTGFDTSMTASKFVGILRDQTDGSSNFIFRPFFGDTSTNWEITATSSIYPNLSSPTSVDLHKMDTWEVIEKLAQSENYISYITPDGKFRWVPKTVDTTTSFEFYGIGITPNFEFGHTIKNVFSYGKKLTNFYSRVSAKFVKDDTNTSFATTALSFAINGTNTAWNLGYRTFSIENFWMDTNTANSLAGAIFDDVSAIDEELNFSTTFIPHLNLLDRVEVSYDATDFSSGLTFWDINDWDSLTWDNSRGDAIVLSSEAFKVLSININLDNFESRYVCRQLNE
jgi:hypothetical protein